MHLFLGRSVYKTPVYCTSPSRFLWKTFCLCCQHCRVQASSWALTISTLVLSVQVLEGRSKEGYYNSLIPQPLHYRIISPPHPPFLSSLAVHLSSLMLQSSCCLSVTVAANMRRGNEAPAPSLRTGQGCRLTCQGNSSATEEMSHLFIPNRRNCSHV